MIQNASESMTKIVTTSEFFVSANEVSSQNPPSRLRVFIKRRFMIKVNWKVNMYDSFIFYTKIGCKIKPKINILLQLLEAKSIICFDVIHHSSSREFGWELGSCSPAERYTKPGVYTTKCCTSPENHILTCKNSDTGGWRDSFLEINGHKFCDDTSGFATRVRLNISGKNGDE